MEFKPEDRVVAKEACSGTTKGDIYTVTTATGKSYLIINEDVVKNKGCSCTSLWELVDHFQIDIDSF